MLQLISDKSILEDNIDDIQNILNTSELNQSIISKISIKTEKGKSVYTKKKISTTKDI